MRKLLLSVLVCILAVMAFSCFEVVSINIDTADVEIGVNDTYDFSKVYSVANATGTATYEVADTTILAVEGSVVKGLKEGTTTVNIKVVADSAEAEGTITVNVVEKRTVAIKFASETAGFKLADANAKYGATYKLPEAPAIEGYKFLGWTLEGAEGYVTEIADVKAEQNVTAVYEILTYTVTYVVGETTTTNVVNYGEKANLAATEVAGYDFLGWSKEKDGTTYETELVVKADVTLYACLAVKKATITYELNGGACEGLVTEIIYESELDLDKLVPTKEHYTFLGWTTEATSTAYISGAQKINADVTYYAQFEVNAYAISYELDGGTLYSKVTSVDYNNDLELATPVKAGNDFLGWSLEKGGTTYVTKLEKVAADVTVYANWSAKTYTITYNYGDATLTGEQKTILSSDKYTLPTPAKDGYTFLGWTTSEYSSAYVTELSEVSADVVLYAHFTDGLVANPANIETVIANAPEGAKITLMPGTYAALTITKKVTLAGPNAGVDAVNGTRGAEARFEGKLVVNADGVVVDGVELYYNAYLLVKDCEGAIIKNVLVTDTNVQNGTTKNIGAFNIANAKNTTITCCNVLAPTTNTKIASQNIYGFGIDGLTYTYNKFVGTFSASTYPDGIRIDSTNGNTEFGTGSASCGIKGDVTIAHNYFEDIIEYSIWFKSFGAGTYNFVDNTYVHCGEASSTYRPLVRLQSYKGGSDQATINIQYNTLNNSEGLLRADSGSLTSNVTVHINYNKVIDNRSTIDIQNSCSGVVIDAENNYFSAEKTRTGVTITNSYATAEEVPTYAGDNGKTYNITYDLNDGSWGKAYYTAEEIGEQFCTDYGHSMKYSQFDTSYTESVYLTNMLSDETIKNKWMWLFTALYNLAGEGNTALEPTTADFSTGTVKGFYFTNLFAFFNTCSHHESNFGTDSYDFSDPEVGKAICALGEVKGEAKGAATYNSYAVTELSVPTKDGYAFLGWRTQDGQIITSIPANLTGDLSLTALWEKAVVAQSVLITNLPEKGIKLYQELQLEWTVVPSNAYNKNVTFYAVDSTIFSITDDGLIKAKSVGTGKLRIKLEGNPEYELYIDIVVWSGDYFDVSYDSESYVEIGKSVKLNAAYIDENSKVKKVTWTAVTPDIATVDANGNVTGVAAGVATIRATVIGDDTLTFDFYVTVLPADVSDAVKFIIENHRSNALTVYNLGIGAGTPVYYYDYVSSVNAYLFNNDLVIDRRYYDQLPEGTKNNGVMSSVEFITVHYTGNMNKGADADNNCDYFNNLDYKASIHYVTGRTNLSDLTGLASGYSEDAYLAFAGLSEKYAGWHASDTSLGETKWYATGIKVAESDPEKPVISVEDGYYTFNGIKSTIAIPTRDDGIVVTGPTFEYNGVTCNTINEMGLAWKIVDGEYYMGNTWWGTQAYGKALCSIGGNHNSIGIESCVDIGSDLEHTWHVTAQLVADIMVRYDLDITRVVGHHFFSGKDCPQPFLENDMQLWYVFIDMVEAEYAKLTTFKDATISAKAVNSDGILRDNGLLVQDESAHCVTYEVTVTVDGVEQKITLATCVESYYKCDCERTEESLQIQGYEIK